VLPRIGIHDEMASKIGAVLRLLQLQRHGIATSASAPTSPNMSPNGSFNKSKAPVATTSFTAHSPPRSPSRSMARNSGAYGEDAGSQTAPLFRRSQHVTPTSVLGAPGAMWSSGSVTAPNMRREATAYGVTPARSPLTTPSRLRSANRMPRPSPPSSGHSTPRPGRQSREAYLPEVIETPAYRDAAF